MKLFITKKGIVDCTSDSRTHPLDTLQDGLEGAIKIVDKEIAELGYAEFHVQIQNNNNDYLKDFLDSENSIIINDKKTCLKLMKYFKENPESLLTVHIHVALWNFFNDGNNCSDYIDIYDDRLEISCQDWYDEELRNEFHERIKELLDDNFSVAINNSLTSLHIGVTEKCPADCNTCYINKGLQRELRKEDWNKLPDAEQYAIGGGEPAEYPLITDFVEYLKKERNGYVSITTNGQKLIDFRTLPDKIAVSIDGLTQDEHGLTHNTDLKKAEDAAFYYRSKDIKVCINHILHRNNIDNVKDFVDKWLLNVDEINLILFTNANERRSKTNIDSLKPTFDQLGKFGMYFRLNCHIINKDINKDKRIVIDSCMGGILNAANIVDIPCKQGLFSKYYRYGSITPCSHSAKIYPNCTVFEEYMTHFFKTLRPLIFIYDKSGTSGAHEWAFRAGFKGKIRHNIEFGEKLKKDTIYILTNDEESSIRERHYCVDFENKMPISINKRI